jgi:hypothetical protein
MLDVYCIDATHSPLSSEETMIDTTVTLQYLNYDIVDVGLFGAVDTFTDINLLGKSKSLRSL